MSESREMTERELKEFVLGVYFRTQAAIEKYMGRERLPEWTEHVAKINADSTKKRLSDPEEYTQSVLSGLNTMLDVYGSDKVMSEEDGVYRLEVHRCGIWDYRENAQAQGVELTLPAPCEFCVDLHYRTAAHLGVPVTNKLGHRSCRWVAGATDFPPEPDPGPGD